MVKISDREIKSIVVSYLWDFPSVIENPQKLLEVVNRYRKKKSTPIDLYIVSSLKRRLSQTKEGKKIYRKLFNEDPPPPRSYFIPPDKLVEYIERICWNEQEVGQKN